MSDLARCKGAVVVHHVVDSTFYSFVQPKGGAKLGTLAYRVLEPLTEGFFSLFELLYIRLQVVTDAFNAGLRITRGALG